MREAEDGAGHASLVRVQGESAEMNGRKLAKAAAVLTLPFGGQLCVFTLWGGNTQPNKAARAALGIGDLGLATKPCGSGGVPLRDARTLLLPPACRQQRGLHWILARLPPSAVSICLCAPPILRAPHHITKAILTKSAWNWMGTLSPRPCPEGILGANWVPCQGVPKRVREWRPEVSRGRGNDEVHGEKPECGEPLEQRV